MSTAPFIAGSTAVIFATCRDAASTHSVVSAPSSPLISTFQASKVPAGTVTDSRPATVNCLTSTFCVCTLTLRNDVE